MKRTLIIACLICLSAIAAVSQTLQQELEKAYAGKVLFLRHPVGKNSQKYDDKGTLLSGGSEGSWTQYGSVQLTDIRLSANKLVIEGNRLEYVYDDRRKELQPANLKKHKGKVNIEIQSDIPINSVEQADTLIHCLFATNEQEFLDSVPPFWRGYVQKHMMHKTESSPLPEEADAADLKPVRIDPKDKAVKPPQVIYAPAPEFPGNVRDLPSGGVAVLDVLVDQQGNVRRPAILRPLGMGFDEAAIATVSKWKFKPATKDGTPVVTEMAIEVAF